MQSTPFVGQSSEVLGRPKQSSGKMPRAMVFGVLLNWGLIVTNGLLPVRAEQPGEVATVEREDRISVEFGKALVGDRSHREFVEFRFEEMPNKIKNNLGTWERWFFRLEHLPLKGARLRAFVWAATESTQKDLVELQWEHRDFPLRLVVSAGGMKLCMDLSRLAEDQFAHWGASVEARAEAVYSEIVIQSGVESAYGNQPFSLSLPWPPRLEDGAAFSTNSKQDILHLPGPRSRVDAFVESRQLSILFYKKSPALIGYLDGSKWFDSEFRASVHERAIREGKMVAKTPEPSQSP